MIVRVRVVLRRTVVGHLTLKMTSAQVVETSVTNNSSSQNYPHSDDHTIQTTKLTHYWPFLGKLGRREEELKAQNSVVDQLRAYIGENLPNTQMEKLQKENEEAKQNITSLLQENEHLRSTVELLNVRLSSMNEILSIQETQLIKFQTKFTKVDSIQGDSLLSKWREKVFALLVQLKSQEIIHEKEKRNERAQVSVACFSNFFGVKVFEPS